MKAASWAVSGVPSWKRGFGPQREFEAVAVRRDGHRLRKQAVDRIGLVERAGHQRIEAHLHARRRIALGHEAVQRVEGLGVLVVDPLRGAES